MSAQTLNDESRPVRIRQNAERRPVLMYDDQSELCRGFAGLVHTLDARHHVRVAPLHSMLGDLIRRTHTEFARRDCVLFINVDGAILSDSDAIAEALDVLGGHAAVVSNLIRRVPRRLRDAVYRVVTSQYALFVSAGPSRSGG
jgi:predicted DCC family thiol-disulfide oxidoreductase YuxK